MSASAAVIGIVKRAATGALYRVSDVTVAGMIDDTSVRTLRMRLEHGQANAADVAEALAIAAVEAPTRSDRLDACRLLGDLAGRALGADWDVAERCAFALLEAARIADTAADRRGVLTAMGRGFR